jgi:hypothetical protein
MCVACAGQRSQKWLYRDDFSFAVNARGAIKSPITLEKNDLFSPGCCWAARVSQIQEDACGENPSALALP